jgi:hypothetical protein
MSTLFARLNDGWNAEPNAPGERIAVSPSEVTLSFLMDSARFPTYAPNDVGTLHFANCWRYRLGATNDEGWCRGQCRFSGIAPEWGEFYELSGDLRAGEIRGDWTVSGEPIAGTRHFLFYLKDSTFECDASSWRLTVQHRHDA